MIQEQAPRGRRRIGSAVGLFQALQQAVTMALRVVEDAQAEEALAKPSSTSSASWRMLAAIMTPPSAVVPAGAEIREQLGDRAGMAGTLSQIGIVHTRPVILQRAFP